MSKFFNVLLAILIAALSALLVRANQNGKQLKQEHDRLALQYGELPVTDEKQFHVVFTPGENPKRQFHWRLYVPDLPNGLGALTRANGRQRSSSSSPTSPADDVMARAKFRVHEGKPELYYSVAGGSTVYQFRKETREFVAAHWDQLELEILAEDGPAIIPPSEALRLLAVKIPKTLHDVLPDDMTEEKKRLHTSTPIFEMLIGDGKALENLR